MEISNRQRRLAAKKKLWSGNEQFTPLDLTNRPHPSFITRVFENNRYIVMITDGVDTTHGKAIRAMIQKNDGEPIKDHWNEIQNIKNEVFGYDALAIEYYPPQNEVVDQAHIYWIWIFPEGIIPKMTFQMTFQNSLQPINNQP